MKLAHISLIIFSILFIFSCSDDITGPEPSDYEIVYVGRDWCLYKMNGDGSDKKKLFKHGLIRSPEYSPDGKKISCITDFEDGAWIVTVDIPTLRMEKIAFLHGYDSYFGFDYYTWSPDGSKIAFNRMKSNVWKADIYMLDVHSKVVTQLTNNLGLSFPSKWSPDQKQIFFFNQEDNIQVSYILDLDGLSFKTPFGMEKGRVNYLDWSPDGEKIVFSDTLQKNIFLSDRDGTNIKQITFESAAIWDPLWSPEGDKISFLSGPWGHSDLYVIKPDGSDKRQITNHSKIPAAPYIWTPGGRNMLYLFNHGTQSMLYKLRIIDSNGTQDIDLETEAMIGFACRVKNRGF